MDKVFEALEEIGNIDLGDNPYKKFEDNKLKNVYNKEFAILYNAIAELKAIKEAEPSEALRKLDDISYLVLNEIDDLKNKELWKSYFNTIKQALLKQLSGSQYTNIVLDEAVKPSEAMECLATMYKLCTPQRTYHKLDVCNNTIKQALLKAQENEKMLEILFEKKVELMSLFLSSSAEQYNNQFVYDRYQLTEEEFAFIKAMIARYGDEK